MLEPKQKKCGSAPKINIDNINWMEGSEQKSEKEKYTKYWTLENFAGKKKITEAALLNFCPFNLSSFFSNF